MAEDKNINNIQELIDTLEEILDEYTDLYQRRDIINIIRFCERQRDAGRKLNDIIWWLQKLGKDAQVDINTLVDAYE